MSIPYDITLLHCINRGYTTLLVERAFFLIIQSIYTSTIHPIAGVSFLCCHEGRHYLNSPDFCSDIFLRDSKPETIICLFETILFGDYIFCRRKICLSERLSFQKSDLDTLCLCSNSRKSQNQGYYNTDYSFHSVNCLQVT